MSWQALSCVVKRRCFSDVLLLLFFFFLRIVMTQYIFKYIFSFVPSISSWMQKRHRFYLLVDLNFQLNPPIKWKECGEKSKSMLSRITFQRTTITHLPSLRNFYVGIYHWEANWRRYKTAQYAGHNPWGFHIKGALVFRTVNVSFGGLFCFQD